MNLDPPMKLMKTVFKVLLAIILLAVLYLGGMIGYASLTDYDPPTTETVAISGAATAPRAPDMLSLINWNIGYCGLGAESDFFYDGGKGVRTPKPLVQKNLEGILNQLDALKPATDFFLLQEVDLRSDRSSKVDQVAAISARLGGYAQVFAANYKVGFIPIPPENPMGGVHSGLATWSRYTPTEATRYSFQGNYDWPTYLFFLDRCFLLERFPLAADGELVLINTHNSAYDDGSLKKAQLEQLSAVLRAEYEKGNYVIAGGDWNQFPPEYRGFEGIPTYNMAKPDPKYHVPDVYPAAGWHWAWDPAVPTNRSLKAVFDPATTERGILDFYLLSPNVELIEVQTLDLGFAFSDHQPVQLQVRLLRPENLHEEDPVSTTE